KGQSGKNKIMGEHTPSKTMISIFEKALLPKAKILTRPRNCGGESNFTNMNCEYLGEFEKKFETELGLHSGTL
ncbi:MAG: hypothetical protein AN484_28310, partial [Aphanizomenon flos-aquae WA102]